MVAESPSEHKAKLTESPKMDTSIEFGKPHMVLFVAESNA